MIRGIFKRIGANANPSKLFNALIFEGIIEPRQVEPLKSSFAAIDAVVSGAVGLSVVGEAIQRDDRVEKKVPRKRARKGTEAQRIKARELIEGDPKSVEGWFLRVFQEYALESKSPDYVEKIAGIRKEVKSLGAEFAEEMERLLKEKKMFTKEDGVNVRKRVNAELEKMKTKDTVTDAGAGSNPSVSHPQQTQPQQTTSSDQPSQASQSNQGNPLQTRGPPGDTSTAQQSSDSGPITASSRKKEKHEVTIAQRLSTKHSQIDLKPSIASWPTDQIARNILLAAGRIIPGEESSPRLNKELEPLFKAIHPLKGAELTTLEWDRLDPPTVDIETSMRMKLQSLAPIPPPPSITKTPITSVSKAKSATAKAAKSGIPGESPKSATPSSTPSKKGTKSTIELPRFTDTDKIPSTAPYFGKIPSVLPPDLSADDSLSTLIPPPVPSATATKPSAETIASLGKSMFKRTTLPAATKPVRKPSTPRKSTKPETPISTPKQTPAKPKMSVEVVITTPPKIRLTPGMAYFDTDVTEITPAKPSTKRKRSSTRSTTVTPAKRTRQPPSPRRQRGSTVVDLTTDKPISIPSSTDTTDKSSSPTTEEKGYKSYRCQWSGCSAELHSFETLQQHVVKVHSKADSKTKVTAFVLLRIEADVDVAMSLAGMYWCGRKRG